MTGWAQVNGRTELPWDERIELDLWYIEHRSPRLDALILWRTLRMVFGGEGLYRSEGPAWRDSRRPVAAARGAPTRPAADCRTGRSRR